MSSEAHDTSAEVDGTQADKINTGALGTLVVVGLLAMLSITAAVTALVRHDIEGEESEKDADQNQTVIQLKSFQRGMLNGPAGYLDRGKGVVSLPIDVAKSVVVSELQKDPNSATPPAPPASASAGTAAAPAADAGAPATVDSAVTSTDAGVKAEPVTKPEPAKEKATEPKPAPAISAKPAAPASAASAPAPKPAPTAATTGALEPGPLNH